MSQRKKEKIPFITNLKYVLKFSKILLQEKFYQLTAIQARFLAYRDSSSEDFLQKKKPILKQKSIKVMEPKKQLVYPLLVLFDAENMPLQEYYKSVKKLVQKEFGTKSWDGAKLETAYKESTEFYNNHGYNTNVLTHYVGYGKNKADDKLVEIARERKIPNVIIVTNDRELISRLEEVAKRFSFGKLFVYNGKNIKEHTLSQEAKSKSELKGLIEKRDRLFNEYTAVEKEIASLVESVSEKVLPKVEKKIIVKKKIVKKEVLKTAISQNLQNAELDVNIRKELMINPVFVNFSEQIEQIGVNSLNECKIQALNVLDLLTKLPNSRNILESKGLNIAIFKVSLHYAIRDFDISNYKFNKFVDFIQYVVKDSSVKLILREPNEYRLLLKNVVINDLEMKEVIDEPNFGIEKGILDTKFSSSLNQDFLISIKKKIVKNYNIQLAS